MFIRKLLYIYIFDYVFNIVQRREGIAHAQVTDGQHIQTSHSEDQEHMNRPDADSFDHRQVFDNLFIAHTI